MRNSFGAFVYGVEVGSFAPASMHVCQTLTMERVQDSKPKSQKKHSLRVGDLCSGLTKEGHKVIGHYMNSEGKYAWIRGQKGSDVTQLELKSAFKVLTDSLQKLS